MFTGPMIGSLIVLAASDQSCPEPRPAQSGARR